MYSFFFKNIQNLLSHEVLTVEQKSDKNTSLEELGIGQAQSILCPTGDSGKIVCPISSQLSCFLMSSDDFLYLSLVNDFRELP